MYEKPEVTGYCGKELLDLMGPAETAYCALDGGQQECGVEFRMAFPDGMEARDLPEDMGIGYIFRGPNNCEPVRGECSDGSALDCIFDDPGIPGPDATYLVIGDGDFCEVVSGCDSTGEWTLEAWWILEGEELPSCTEKFDFDW